MALIWNATVWSAASGTNSGNVSGMARRTIMAARLTLVKSCLLYTSYVTWTWLHVGFPIQKSADQRLFASPRSFSQLTTSFFGSQCQGIRPAPFLAWPFSQSWFFHLPTRVSRNCRFLYQSFVFSNLRSSCSVFKVHSAVWTSFSFSEEVVGSSGLEPPTSRLSGCLLYTSNSVR